MIAQTYIRKKSNKDSFTHYLHRKLNKFSTISSVICKTYVSKMWQNFCVIHSYIKKS